MSQSAERALQILQIVGRSPEPLTLLEVAQRARLDKSTAARLLAVLENGEFLQRDRATRAYSAGPLLMSLGAAAMARLDVTRLARPELERLRDSTGETTSLHLRIGTSRLCVDGAESRHALRRGVPPLGETLPLFVGPSGKAIVAFLPGDEQARILSEASLAGANAEALSMMLAALRHRGYIAVIGDRTPGIGAISAPLFDYRGVLASLTVAGPSERWGLSEMAAHADDVISTAMRLSALMGGIWPRSHGESEAVLP